MFSKTNVKTIKSLRRRTGIFKKVLGKDYIHVMMQDKSKQKT